MNLKDIASLRLSNQQLSRSSLNKPTALVQWMGALQAQDYAMSKWAIGIRLPHTTEEEIEKALHKGSILRTHVLRPTWHLVAADNIRWMLELTAPHIKASARSRDKALELTEKTYTKSNGLIEKALSGNHHLTREELMTVLEQHKMIVDPQRAVHFMLRAELEGIACSGWVKQKKQTYALLDERVAHTKKLHRDEALVKLATIYFSSHAPATVKDFSWWSGLSLTDSKKAMEGIKEKFITEKIGDEIYWLPSHLKTTSLAKPSAHFLPAFDEFIISYKDRSATLALEHQKVAFSSNGIFRPVILVNGQGIGIWNRTNKKDQIQLETTFFKPVNSTTHKLLAKEAEVLGHFLSKKVLFL
ncbi:MAG: hypothetical protein JWO58_694 [Chitinophagaceae bacterium]|nr:hypothetical protein [Chitinophagaceae bacterium]